MTFSTVSATTLSASVRFKKNESAIRTFASFTQQMPVPAVNGAFGTHLRFIFVLTHACCFTRLLLSNGKFQAKGTIVRQFGPRVLQRILSDCITASGETLLSLVPREPTSGGQTTKGDII